MTSKLPMRPSMALLAIAKADLAMNKKVDAIATYRLLLTKPAVGDKERVAVSWR